MFAPPIAGKAPPMIGLRPSNASRIHEPQRAGIGNQATLRRLSPRSELQISRKCAACEEEDKGHPAVNRSAISRATEGGAQPSAVPPIVSGVLSSNGRPMDGATRSFFESRFGHNFSRVRIHTGARAAESAHAVDAHAYAVGSHLVFGSNQFSPDTHAGRKLIAHELSHVVQQSQSATSHRLSGISNPGDALEVDADRRADRAMSSKPRPGAPPPASASAEPVATGLQRYAVPESLKCDEVADWMNNNSPYRPEWAETACNYAFNGNVDVSAPVKAGKGNVSITATGNKSLNVTGSCPTDLPVWSPATRPGQAAEATAWASMIATLDKHEGVHRALGETWRAKLDQRFKTVNKTVTGTDEADATAKLNIAITDMRLAWEAEAQAAQKKLDPFRGAHLTCPAAVAAPSAPPAAPGAPGGSGSPAPAPAPKDSN
jgi:Domain of unknown function (DUF4157)